MSDEKKKPRMVREDFRDCQKGRSAGLDKNSKISGDSYS